MKSSIISTEDYNIVKKLAEKYEISVEEFGRMLLVKSDKSIIKQVKVSKEELEIIDARAKAKIMKRSPYISACCSKALREKLYMKVNMQELQKDAYGKERTVREYAPCVSFSNADTYKELCKVAKQYEIKVSTLIRAIALTVEL